MTELVKVSDADNAEHLVKTIEDLFRRKRYEHISEAIGIYSILIDPQRTLADQSQFYRHVLTLIKDKVRNDRPKTYASWLVAFPQVLTPIVEKGEIVTDEAAQRVLAARLNASGPFTSIDAFFSWALEDRRLPLDHIIRYVEKTVELYGRQKVN